MDATPHTTPHEAPQAGPRPAEPTPRPADAASASAAEPALAMFADAARPVRDRLGAYLALGNSLDAVAKAIRRAPRSVADWYRGGFAGDEARLERAVGQFLCKQGLQATPVFRPEFAWTPVAEDIVGACLAAELDQDIALICGSSGVGKSTAVRHYVETEPNAYYVCYSAAWTAQSMVQQIARQVQLDRASKDLATLCQEIVDCLKGASAVLVVDESQHACSRSLEVLRSIYDESACGLVLVAQLDFWARLKRGDGVLLYDQLRNRIGITLTIRESSLADLAAVLPQDTSLPVLKHLHKASKGCLRHSVKAYSRALRAAATQGESKVTVPLLKELESS